MSEPNNPGADGTGAPPAGPAIVKKGAAARKPAAVDQARALKGLQESQSRLEDRLTGLTKEVDGVKGWLAELFPGGRKPAAPTTGQGKGFLDELGDLLG